MSGASRPIEVLVADDDPVARQVLTFYLENFGCRVQAAQDGHEALDALRDGAEWIGLVILDARMPGPPPIQLYQTIRQSSPRVPILFCSGVEPHDPVIRAINEHGLGLLTKPFHRADLYQAVLNVLQQSDAPAMAL